MFDERNRAPSREFAAEDVQRQVAVVPIVAMEETPFLLPVQRIVSRVQVQDDFFRLFAMSLEKDLHQQAVHGSMIQHDLFVALLPTGRLFGQFQPIQGALSC